MTVFLSSNFEFECLSPLSAASVEGSRNGERCIDVGYICTAIGKLFVFLRCTGVSECTVLDWHTVATGEKGLEKTETCGVSWQSHAKVSNDGRQKVSGIDDKVYLVSQAMKTHSALKFIEDADNETIQKFRTIRSGSLAVKMTIFYLTLTQESINSCATSKSRMNYAFATECTIGNIGIQPYVFLFLSLLATSTSDSIRIYNKRAFNTSAL